MKRTYVVCMIYLLAATFILAQSNPPSITGPSTKAATANASQPDPKAQAKVLESYGKLPLTFEPNQGQTDAQVKFLSRTSAYILFLTQDEAVITLPAKKQPPRSKLNKSPVETRLAASPASATEKVLRMTLRHANPSARITGEDALPGTANYFIGNDPKKWRTSVPTYAKVRYEQIYSGIDLVYYGNQRQLEYDFIVAPGANPSRIAFDFRGASQIRRNAQGDLVIRMTTKPGEAEIRWHKPLAYQEKNGMRQEIAAGYSITGANRVGFEVAKYDPSRPLYIDPLIYSTYLGGSGYDLGSGIAVDNEGNAYVTGLTWSTDFPTTNALQPDYGGNIDAFVTKFNATGSALVYSTYLGGGGQDESYGIAVDSSGNAYVTGDTSSTDFPTTRGVLQTTYGGSTDAFVSELNPTGSALVYSTYLGGSGGGVGYGIAVDSAGNAYVTGYTSSTDFPVTPGAFQTVCGCGGYEDVFLSKINATGTDLVYSTYLGGGNADIGTGVAVGSSGEAYVTGRTFSTDFPTTSGAFQTICGGGCGYWDAFVTKFNSTGSALVYSTYLGGSNEDLGNGIALDTSGDTYVVGVTASTDFPTTPGAFQTTCNPISCGGSFVTKMNSTGSALVYSTYLVGGSNEGSSIAVDSSGNAYVTGYADTTGFPTMYPLQPNYGGGDGIFAGDAFVTEFNTSGSALVYSTYLGGSSSDQGTGIAVDSAGDAYVAGWTCSTDFPTMNPLQPVSGGPACTEGTYGDAFVSKISAADAPFGMATPTEVNFGQVMVDRTSPRKSVSLKNVGGSKLSLTDISISGDFALPVNDCASGVKPGTHCNVYVTFTPHALGAQTGTLAFVDNASNSPQIVSLTGAGANLTTTTLTSSPNPSTHGEAVTFSAVVNSSAGAPPDGETVSFMKGKTVLGTGTLSGGSANFTTSTLKVGTASVTVVYSGDPNFAPSTSKAVKQVVEKAAN